MAGSRFGSFKSEKGDSAEAAAPRRKGPYAVLGVDRNATDEEIRSAYRRMALRYHPDKNGGDPFSADMFQEVAFSYSILSDPNKRRQYNTGMPDTEPTELLCFDIEENGGLSLALQEDSVKAGKVTSAGMYFLGFPVCRFEKNNSASPGKYPFSSLDTAMYPDTTGFKRLDSFQPCDINELKPGTHYFAVYGDDFFTSSSYTIEIVGGESFPAGKEKLRSVEAKILRKQAELSKFEAEYREVLAKFVEMPWKYDQQMRTIDKLLNERNAIHAAYTKLPTNHPTSPPAWKGCGLALVSIG